MFLSKRTKYALKALGLLAREHGKGPLQIADVARRERIPKKFLEAILLLLRNRGILESRKGKGGGYLLHRAPADITLGSILRIFEGSIAPLPCVDGPPVKPCDECADPELCAIRLVTRDAYAAAARELDLTTLADMIDRENKARQRRSEALLYDI